MSTSGPGQPEHHAVPERTFGWWDMFVHPDEDPRDDGGWENTERATLEGVLRDQRLTLRLKCQGLDAEQLARRSVPPSDLSLLGLVRHLADVERHWFRRVMAGQDVPRLFGSNTASETGSREFSGAAGDPELVTRAWDAWRDEVAFAERFVAQAPDLGITSRGGQTPVPLRQVVVHLIEEYARHNGHADFLRERIDGRVGQ